MRRQLIVLFIVASVGLAMAVASNPEPGSKVAAGLARGAISGVILGSNNWPTVAADVQSRLLLQQAVSDPGRDGAQEQED